MGNKRLFLLLEFSQHILCFQNYKLHCEPGEKDSLTDELWPATQPSQPRTGRGVTPQMRSSASLNDHNFICPRRTVPICIRQTSEEGGQKQLDTSHSESNSNLEGLHRKKKKNCLEDSSVYEPYHCFSPTIWIQLTAHWAAEVREWTHFPNEHH